MQKERTGFGVILDYYFIRLDVQECVDTLYIVIYNYLFHHNLTALEYSAPCQLFVLYSIKHTKLMR